MTEHDFARHYQATFLVVSSSHSNPADQFQQLNDHLNQLMVKLLQFPAHVDVLYSMVLFRRTMGLMMDPGGLIRWHSGITFWSTTQSKGTPPSTVKLFEI